MPAQLFLRGLLLWLLLVLLVGCTAAATPSPTPSPAAPLERPPATLYLWHAWPASEQRTLNQLIAQFQRAYPTVTIVPQARPAATLLGDLRAAVADGRGPHMVLLQSHTLGLLASEQALAPLDALFSPADLAPLLPSAVGSASVASATGETQLYGLPLSVDTAALFYNKANWLIAPSDTDAWLSGARGLTDTSGAPPVWGLAFHLSLDTTLAYLPAFEGAVFDAQGDLALGATGRAGTERWLAWIQALRQDPRILASTDSVVVDNALQTQQALMTLDWAHALSNYRNLWGENLGVAALPRLTETDLVPQPYVQSDVLAISALVSDQATQVLIAEFGRFLLTEGSQRALLAVDRQPASTAFPLDPTNPDEAIALVLREQARNGRPLPNSRAMTAEVWPILDDMRLSVLRNLATPTQAIDSADSQIRARLNLP